MGGSSTYFVLSKHFTFTLSQSHETDPLKRIFSFPKALIILGIRHKFSGIIERI
jgi:hypothetical protein